MLTVRRVLLLLGAGRDREFWSPLAHPLPADCENIALAWSGLGISPTTPPLAGSTIAGVALTTPSDLIAQSMGGVVALRLAARYPEKVPRRVLVATSGGFDLAARDAEDGRDEYRRTYPDAAAWITKSSPRRRAGEAAITAHALLLS